jgi:hypothetical protein
MTRTCASAGQSFHEKAKRAGCVTVSPIIQVSQLEQRKQIVGGERIQFIQTRNRIVIGEENEIQSLIARYLDQFRQ